MFTKTSLGSIIITLLAAILVYSQETNMYLIRHLTLISIPMVERLFDRQAAHPVRNTGKQS